LEQQLIVERLFDDERAEERRTSRIPIDVSQMRQKALQYFDDVEKRTPPK
jgi:hypothetical protein